MTTKLVITSGKSAGKAIAIKKEQLLIGRAEECDVRLLSDQVSRRHCKVLVEPDTVWVEDLGSRNGTFVNGTRIIQKTKVYEGDTIKIGSLEVRVSGGTAGIPTDVIDDSPASWNDEGEVSRWLLGESTASAIIRDTKQTTAVQRPSDEVNPADPQEGMPTDGEQSAISRISIDEIKASRSNPGVLPQEAKKSVASSREAAAEALKKLFGNR